MMYDPKKNNLLEIFGVSFILGSYITFSIIYLIFISNKYSSLIYYSIYLEIFFILEFINTYLYQNIYITSNSFLIYGNKGNKEFWYMQILTIWEYLSIKLILKFIQYSSRNYYLKNLGLLFIIIGLYLRHLSMKTCGLSFNHYLITEKKSYHKLITTGIYKYIRHPSYFGFFLFCIGIQLWLSNYINLIINCYILYHFFNIRIQYEEKLLIEFYKDDYRNYQKKTYKLIPFIK